METTENIKSFWKNSTVESGEFETRAGSTSSGPDGAGHVSSRRLGRERLHREPAMVVA